MKRIKSILLAITLLLAAPAFLTSCQEDAPEINYTMNVSVINDFTKVVEAINSGFLKNEQAIQKLTEAIDKMNADQQTKLQAVIDVLNSVNATLDTKLAAIEAAMKAQTLSLEAKLDLLETAVNNQTLKQEEMAGKLTTAIDNLSGTMEAKLDAITEAIDDVNATLDTKLDLIEAAMRAQTLSLEGKLDLLETAIKALPDYTAQLEAIKTAIEALPDYGDKLTALENAIKALPDNNDKFDAVVAALDAMKAQIEALGTGQTEIAGKIAEVTTAINALIAEVKSGNTSAAAALAQIIQKLEELKAAIGSGGGGGTTVAVTGVSLNSTSLSLKVDATATLVATVRPDGATNKAVTWKSDAPTIAKVDDSGKVTALAEGYATITVTTVDGGKTATCAVTVVAAGGEDPPTEDYVDLGLPSGLKWATKNLGASKPSDYGDYYAWGETEPKADYSWETYKWGLRYNLIKYNDTDGKTTLDPEDDAAIAKLGLPWRMPSKDEINELRKKCTWTWTTQDGKNGYEVKSKTNGNAIFLPAAGYRKGSELCDADSWGIYLSRSLVMKDKDSGDAYCLGFDLSGHDCYDNIRCYGLPVRPVRP